jgi:hypothetical protein
MGLIAVVVGVLISFVAIFSFGVSIFMRMRTRDWIMVFLAAPIMALIGAIIGFVGYASLGYGDIPDGWVSRIVFGVFGFGVIAGIVARAKGVTSPAIEATKYYVPPPHPTRPVNR